MRQERASAPRWIILSAIGLASAILLACFWPTSLTRLSPATEPTLPPTIAPTRAPAGSAGAIAPGVTRITEQQINEHLQSQRTSLGEGLDCRELSVRNHDQRLTAQAMVEVSMLQGAIVPVEADLLPTVRDGRVQLDVLDVRLGDRYATLGAIVKPLLTTGIAESFAKGFTAEKLLAERGIRITRFDLHEGYLDVTSEPVK